MNALMRTMPVCIVLAIMGCQSRLNRDLNSEVEAGDTNIITVDAPRYDQKVVVEFSSSDGPISVYVGLKKNEDAINKAALSSKAGADVIAKSEKTPSGSLEVNIPAKEEFIIVVQSHAMKKTTVTTKIRGK